MKTATIATMLLACTTLAQAQSSATLYGRLDVGFDYTTVVRSAGGASGSRFRAQSSDWGASYFGLTGVEGFGSGWSALYNLEAGLNLMTGTSTGSAGQLFNRKAYVGLKSDPYGRVMLGRNLFIANGQWDADPMFGATYSAASLIRGRNVPITSNNVDWQSPSFGGFDVYAQYALGNQASGFNQGAAGGYGRSDGVQLTYRNGGVLLRGMYDELRDANGQFSNVFLYSRELFAGAAVTLGALTMMAGYNHLHAPDTPTGVANRADHGWIGAKYQLAPQWLLHGGLFHVRVDGGAGDATHDASGHATMIAAGAQYHLSKRTFLYGNVAHVTNSNTTHFGVGGNRPGTDNNNLDNPLTGQGQSGIYVGMLTTF
ncbi:porin [Ralstonia pseudosolanacearum]|uniref:porin n=1 Tax=Ralstonia pseudosolanacearum TaxID=1310165 RepID=UPI0018D0430D|nr:porin [Ralstonia pseudosolanacearum]